MFRAAGGDPRFHEQLCGPGPKGCAGEGRTLPSLYVAAFMANQSLGSCSYFLPAGHTECPVAKGDVVTFALRTGLSRGALSPRATDGTLDAPVTPSGSSGRENSRFVMPPSERTPVLVPRRRRRRPTKPRDEDMADQRPTKNPGNFAADRERASRAGHVGGQHSSGNFARNPARAAEAGRKGGRNSHGERGPQARPDDAPGRKGGQGSSSS